MKHSTDSADNRRPFHEELPLGEGELDAYAEARMAVAGFLDRAELGATGGGWGRLELGEEFDVALCAVLRVVEHRLVQGAVMGELIKEARAGALVPGVHTNRPPLAR